MAVPRKPSASAQRLPPEDACWAAVLTRDGSLDGQLYYAVTTTGVYCRPTCPVRRPKRAHVRFHHSPEAAEADGFRPCKRCRPDRPATRAHLDKIAEACRMIETAETPPSLAALAGAAGLSSGHFHRLFKATLGLTPRAYTNADRNRRMRAALSMPGSVTEAVYDSGFNASSRFYAAAPQALGMTPKGYRAGGVDEIIRYAVSNCSFGRLLAAASEKGICAILLADETDELVLQLRQQFHRATIREGGQEMAELISIITTFMDEPNAQLDLPLDIRGTAFQHRVWEALRRIQPGTTASYTDIAVAVGAPAAARAVARACAANRLAVAVPCHRVVGRDGSLAGYRWGVDRKRELLAAEARGAKDALPAKKVANRGRKRSRPTAPTCKRPTS